MLLLRTWLLNTVHIRGNLMQPIYQSSNAVGELGWLYDAAYFQFLFVQLSTGKWKVQCLTGYTGVIWDRDNVRINLEFFVYTFRSV